MPQGKHPSGDGGMSAEDALKRAAALCSRQEMSSGQIRDKLSAWGVKEEDFAQVLKKLVEEKFLDDARFALYYSRDKFRLNGWGRIKIGHMLRAKGVDSEQIDEALAQLDEEAYFDRCLELLREKARSVKDKNAYSRKGKLYRFASGRGYESDIIHRAIDQLD